jgi:hypothetical protein
MDGSRRHAWNFRLGSDLPVDVEEVPEFHAARLLIVIFQCGTGSRKSVRGRTKLAKLDFFVRYPRFLEIALDRLRRDGQDLPAFSAGSEGVEASMVRYKYGPWDHRYYNLLGLLDARNLVDISSGQKVETYTLTKEGRDLATRLLSMREFAPVARRAELVSNALGRMSGTDLKNFVYETFLAEVAALPQGTIIR